MPHLADDTWAVCQIQRSAVPRDGSISTPSVCGLAWKFPRPTETIVPTAGRGHVPVTQGHGPVTHFLDTKSLFLTLN